MKKVCIFLVLITNVYQNAGLKNRKIFQHLKQVNLA